MKAITRILYFMLIPTVFFLSNCNHSEHEIQEKQDIDTANFINTYAIKNFVDTNIIDSLLINVVTYIGNKPIIATYQTKFNREFREHYVRLSEQFRFFLYFVHPDDNFHYYYIVRPARSIEGNRRGVFGRYKLNNDAISKFEEICNTHVGNDKEIELFGITIFNRFLANESIDSIISDINIIEWPDDRLRYDKTKYEWRYDLE
jgi:hypothetical protein